MWYRGTSLMRNCFLLGPYSRPAGVPRSLKPASSYGPTVGLCPGLTMVLWGAAFCYERGGPVKLGQSGGYQVGLYGRHVEIPEMRLTIHKIGRMDQLLHVAPARGREGRRK